MIRSILKLAATNLLPEPVLHRMRWWRALASAAKAGRHSAVEPRAHELSARLVVSLTSYPARFATLHLTLRSLLNQTIAADAVQLWIAHADFDHLPPAVTALTGQGLEIRACDDLRSYKKLIPALAEDDSAFIVTADDDIFYPPTWLERLAAAFDSAQPTVTCMRAHRPHIYADGTIAPYRNWGWEVSDAEALRGSADVMPTGNGGILYFPGALHPDVLDRAAFQALAPNADDLWFYWMGRRVGTRYKVADRSFRLIGWPYPEDQTLAGDNIGCGNDRQVRALAERYGNPRPIAPIATP